MVDRGLTKEAAAALLSQSPRSLADPRWRRRVGLRATRVGRMRFLESEVMKLLRRGLEPFPKGEDKESGT